MINAYINYWSTFLTNELIICQYTGKKRFLLYHLEDATIRSFFLSLNFSLLNLGTQLLGFTYFSDIIF